MNNIWDLNDENFMIFAIKAYDKPNCVMSEFETDIKRVKYIKRLIRKFKLNNDLKERLILNHIIVLGNVFGVEFTTRMLFYKIDSIDYDVLKTFLLYLNYLPTRIDTIKGESILLSEIIMNPKAIERLRCLK